MRSGRSAEPDIALRIALLFGKRRERRATPGGHQRDLDAGLLSEFVGEELGPIRRHRAKEIELCVSHRGQTAEACYGDEDGEGSKREHVAPPWLRGMNDTVIFDDATNGRRKGAPRFTKGTRLQPTVRFGIDLGGTKIETAGLAAEGRELMHRRVVTPATTTCDARCGGAAGQRSRDGGSAAQGPVGRVPPGASRRRPGCWGIEFRVPQWPADRCDLARLLKGEVRLANDANCFALSEATDGAGADARVVFGAIRDRRGRRHGGRWSRARRPQRDCRRVGAQSAAVAGG